MNKTTIPMQGRIGLKNYFILQYEAGLIKQIIM